MVDQNQACELPADSGRLQQQLRAAEAQALRAVEDVRRLYTLERQHRQEFGERIRAGLVAMTRAQEEEREWLSYEVHDRIAQTLASVFQQLQLLESQTRALPELRRAAERGSILVRQAIREARNIMNDLRPPLLDEFGLAPLVEEELRHLAEDTGCRTGASLAVGARPPRTVEIVLYRILHEALVNVRRHARAGHVAVSLTCDGVMAQLQVEDDGAGFTVVEAMGKERVGGLLGMKRRAELAGGACRVESAPGTGTRVCVCMPVSADGPPLGRGACSGACVRGEPGPRGQGRRAAVAPLLDAAARPSAGSSVPRGLPIPTGVRGPGRSASLDGSTVEALAPDAVLASTGQRT